MPSNVINGWRTFYCTSARADPPVLARHLTDWTDRTPTRFQNLMCYTPDARRK